MRVAEIMSHPVETTTADEAAEAAYERMRRKRIHHLIVKEGARIVGVLSSRDLDGPEQQEFRRVRTVGDLMTPFAVQVRDTTPVRRAANLMRGRNIGCIPVVDSHARVVGIVTTTDLLELIGKGAERPVAKPVRKTLARRAPARYPKPAR
jgi:CBS domain-containing protein